MPDPLPDAFHAVLPVYLHDPWRPSPAGLRGLGTYPEVSRRTWSALTVDYDLRREISRITAPVLLVDGEGDPFGLEAGQALERALISARVTRVVLERCGHFWHERPAPFFDELRRFLGRDG